MTVSLKKPAYWIISNKENQILLKKNKSGYQLPLFINPPLKIVEQTIIHNLPALKENHFYAYLSETTHLNKEEYQWFTIRESYYWLPAAVYKQVGKAIQLIHWDINSRFCSFCSTPLKQVDTIEKVCPHCNREYFPPISTAILVLIRKKDQILLAESHNFKGKFHSLIAGFLETGETLEECVQREVWEETRLKIKNITYFGNQPWPFPSGLMVGFIADYDSGDIILQEEELKSAKFYTKENLPTLPQKLSLARRMIDWWLEHTSKLESS